MNYKEIGNIFEFQKYIYYNVKIVKITYNYFFNVLPLSGFCPFERHIKRVIPSTPWLLTSEGSFSLSFRLPNLITAIR